MGTGNSFLLWQGPEVDSARLDTGDRSKILVKFRTDPSAGGLYLNHSAACPLSMKASPLGRLCCTGAGFEILVGGQWSPALNARLDPTDPTNNTVVLQHSKALSNVAADPVRVRYAYADWPVCSVRNFRGSGGSTHEPLPARIFDIALN